jgi:hypothetical protein
MIKFLKQLLCKHECKHEWQESSETILEFDPPLKNCIWLAPKYQIGKDFVLKITPKTIIKKQCLKCKEIEVKKNDK